MSYLPRNAAVTTAVLFSLLMSFFSTGCSTVQSSTSLGTTAHFSVELYLSRTALTGTEFEQYKLLPMGLFMECGLVRKGRPVPNHQAIHPITNEVRSELGGILVALSEKVKSKGGLVSAPAGKNTDIFDPGEFLLSAYLEGAPIEVKTSLDATTNGVGEFEQGLARLAEVLRGVPSEPPCKNPEFFGLHRRLRE